MRYVLAIFAVVLFAAVADAGERLTINYHYGPALAPPQYYTLVPIPQAPAAPQFPEIPPGYMAVPVRTYRFYATEPETVVIRRGFFGLGRVRRIERVASW